MRLSQRGTALGLFVVGVLAVTGCGNEDKLFDVSGTVSYEGKPVPKGVVWFDPEPGNPAPQGYAMIADGKYDTAAKGGAGVRGGPYLIRIQGHDGVVGPELPLGKQLFPDYHEKKDLPKAKSEANFDVKKK